MSSELAMENLWLASWGQCLGFWVSNKLIWQFVPESFLRQAMFFLISFCHLSIDREIGCYKLSTHQTQFSLSPPLGTQTFDLTNNKLKMFLFLLSSLSSHRMASVLAANALLTVPKITRTVEDSFAAMSGSSLSQSAEEHPLDTSQRETISAGSKYQYVFLTACWPFELPQIFLYHR